MNDASAPVPVADLHCDLLSYLVMGTGRGPDDAVARCAAPQLRAGGVRVQVMAIFVRTAPGSVGLGERQVERFAFLERERPRAFRRVHDAAGLRERVEANDGPTGILAAVENASGFCDETEPIGAGLDRLERFVEDAGPLGYVGLTWNEENRFGGGNAATAGLKDDGRRLLDRLAGRGVAVDLSHASDALAHDILEHVARNGAEIPVLASHSNFRALCATPRNLPDEIASEIARRDGVIGLNFIRHFCGEGDVDALARHVARARGLGSGTHGALGADFFFSGDLPADVRRSVPGETFFDGFGNASCYPSLFAGLVERHGLSREAIEALAWRNATGFLARNLDGAKAS